MFDCLIMELFDDIVYGIYDLEDVIVMDMVDKYYFVEDVIMLLKVLDVLWLLDNIEVLINKLFSVVYYERKNVIGVLVNSFIIVIEIKGVEGFVYLLLVFNVVMFEYFV